MADQSELRKFGFRGYEIGGWGSLIALIIPLGTLSWTMYDKFFIGPSPQLVPPDIVEFWCKDWATDATSQREKCADDANLLVRVSPLTFLNRASPPHSYVVKTLTVDISFMVSHSTSIKNLRLSWQYFSEISISNEKRTPVAPFMVDGSAAVAKEIEFYPRREVIPVQTAPLPIASERNFYKFAEFQKLISAGATKNIFLKFVAAVFDSDTPITAFCRVPVDQAFVRNAAVSYALFSRECHS
jgi:hypothetical protein